MADTTRIIDMLSRGYSATIVASALGVSDSYISQLVSDPAVREQISANRVASLDQHIALDDSVTSLEEKALDKLHTLLPFITDPMKALRIYQVANDAKRKAGEQNTPTDNTNVIVNINMPVTAAVHFQMSSDKQVTEVNGRSMATLPSNVLTNRLVESRQRRALADSGSASSILSAVESGVELVPVRNILQGESA